MLVNGKNNGFYIGKANDFNAPYAIDATRFWHFLESTQKEEVDKLKRSSDWQLRVLERLDRMIKKYGLLRLLKKVLTNEILFSKKRILRSFRYKKFYFWLA